MEQPDFGISLYDLHRSILWGVLYVLFLMLPLLAQLSMRRKAGDCYIAALSGHGHFGVLGSNEKEED